MRRAGGTWRAARPPGRGAIRWRRRGPARRRHRHRWKAEALSSEPVAPNETTSFTRRLESVTPPAEKLAPAASARASTEPISEPAPPLSRPPASPRVPHRRQHRPRPAEAPAEPSEPQGRAWPCRCRRSASGGEAEALANAFDRQGLHRLRRGCRLLARPRSSACGSGSSRNSARPRPRRRQTEEGRAVRALDQFASAHLRRAPRAVVPTLRPRRDRIRGARPALGGGQRLAADAPTRCPGATSRRGFLLGLLTGTCTSPGRCIGPATTVRTFGGLPWPVAVITALLLVFYMSALPRRWPPAYRRAVRGSAGSGCCWRRGVGRRRVPPRLAVRRVSVDSRWATRW